ncbi:STAS domain-containing protein [Streptomyces sp. NPDC001480]|uniref:STAS domain-containing protein n=1 Tax=Streptomyces sp. NPDC001480 TaxID=3364577 RepID=UPI0036AB53FF
MAENERAGRTPQPGGLSVVSATTDGIRVLTLAGEIDHHTGDELRQALDVCDTVRPRIVVDMRQIAFMDSSGINLFITAHQAVTEPGGWLRPAGPTRAVRRTLQLVGVWRPVPEAVGDHLAYGSR